MHFFFKLFGQFKKKQYLCTRFRKGSVKYIIGAVVQLVRIHACHAWGREFESRPHREEDASASSFVFAHHEFIGWVCDYYATNKLRFRALFATLTLQKHEKYVIKHVF